MDPSLNINNLNKELDKLDEELEVWIEEFQEDEFNKLEDNETL